jgi:hypothetical protein
MSSIGKFLHQRPMTKAPPLARKNARADDGDVRSMTGPSGPAAPPGHRHIVYHKHGDHRQEGLHSGSKTSSKPPPVNAGRPLHGPMNGGDTNGIDA